MAYGIRGTSSFVYLDNEDTVRYLRSGYRKDELRKTLEELQGQGDDLD